MKIYSYVQELANHTIHELLTKQNYTHTYTHACTRTYTHMYSIMLYPTKVERKKKKNLFLVSEGIGRKSDDIEKYVN